MKAGKRGLPSASKLNCSKVLLHLFALKCEVLISVLLCRRCYLFMAIKQKILICLEDLMEIFPAGRKFYSTHTQHVTVWQQILLLDMEKI